MWEYNKKKINSIEDIPKKYKEYTQIIYKITCKSTGKFYIGKKILYNNRKVLLSKKKKNDLKTRAKYEYVVKESDWLNYWGSSKELLEDIKIHGINNFKREIIQFVKGKKQATAWELYWIIKTDALISDLGYNGNILGRIFKRDFDE